MDEQIFFDHDGVKVTNARFVNDGQTYAMSNITSVKAFEQQPKRFGAILLLLLCVMLMTAGGAGALTGLIGAVACIVFMAKQKPMFHVMLSTAGGEVSALKTEQRDYLDKVVAALNSAIVYRG